MIFTIGYQGLKLPELEEVREALDATIVDVRSKPRSRNPAYNGSALARVFGPRYTWQGKTLGGMPPYVMPDGLAWLTDRSRHETLILMCMERAPGECHRHHRIALSLPEPVYHVFHDVVVEARELARSMASEDDYDWTPLEAYAAPRISATMPTRSSPET